MVCMVKDSFSITVMERCIYKLCVYLHFAHIITMVPYSHITLPYCRTIPYYKTNKANNTDNANNTNSTNDTE